MVTTIIISKELNPVILTPTRLRARMLSVTTAIESPTERATLSTAFICRKKTSVQAKPGRRNSNVKPRIALGMGTDSRKREIRLTASLSQSKPYVSSLSIFSTGDV